MLKHKMELRITFFKFIILILLTIVSFAGTPANFAFGSSGYSITSSDINPEIIYIREGQTKNLYDYIREFSYTDSLSVVKDFSNQNTASSELKALTKNLVLSDQNFETQGFYSISLKQNGDITGLSCSIFDPQIVFEFGSNRAEARVKVIVLPSKPHISDEKFDIYEDGSTDGLYRIYFIYPDNTDMYQYRVGKSEWKRINTTYILGVDGINYNKAYTQLSTLNNIQIRCKGIGGSEWSEPFTLSAEEIMKGGDNYISSTDIDSTSANYKISGKVLYPNGKPLKNAVVKLNNDSNWICKTNVLGAYEFTNIASGTHLLTVEYANYRKYSANVIVNNKSFKADPIMLHGYSINGYVVNASKQPINRAEVILNKDNNWKTYTNSSGYFEIKDTLPGTHSVNVKYKDFKDYTGTIKLTNADVTLGSQVFTM